MHYRCAEDIGARTKQWLVAACNIFSSSFTSSRKAVVASLRALKIYYSKLRNSQISFEASFGEIEDFTYAFAASYVICETKTHNFKHQPSKPVPLPTWCLIKDVIFAPEQLQNKLARSMLAGEILCKSIADKYTFEKKRPCLNHGGYLLDIDRAHAWADNELLSDCRTIILSINNSSESEERLGSKYFATAKLIDRDCMADDCRMMLIANEFVYLLSYALARKIFFASNERYMIEYDTGAALRRFALISEVALVSRYFFGGADFSLHEEINMSREIYNRCRSSANKNDHSFYELARFGLLITHVLQQISDDTLGSRPYRCTDPLRLLELSDAILAPL